MSRRFTRRNGSIALAAMAGVSLLAVQAHAAPTATSTKTTTVSTTKTSSTLTAATTTARAPTLAPTPTTTRPITASWGDIQPFWGDIQPFWGDIQPLWGDIQPFWGDIQPFWGDIQPFQNPGSSTSTLSTSSTTGAVSFWGSLPGYRDAKGVANGEKVGEYWKGAGAKWEEVMTVWARAQKSGSRSDLNEVNSKVGEVIKTAGEFWSTTYTAQTGKTFTSGFVTPLLAKYGIKTSDPTTYAKLTTSQQAMLFMEFYDGLMSYSKADHVDHWMGTVHWNPQLTQTMGSGADTVIGLLDFTVLNGSIVRNNVVNYDGASKFTNGHGAAVAGLMVGAHDGTGVMGISPRSRVIAFNPFDETGTAGWEDIATGVKMLTTNKASIVNMSLGVPGTTLDQGWNGVFSRADVSPTAKNSLFIVAAGNQGVRQSTSIDWNYATNPEILVVGSVTLDGRISNFSNRPGTACLLSNGKCPEGARLMDRFLVAPGELILVEDDAGGVKRASGTSFAAPLVTGAAALIQDRWP
ncbi:MAG: S8 family peptidase, partial [Phenylobacterium sp.]